MQQLFEVRFGQKFGRGLFAKTAIKMGQWVTLCETLVLSEQDTKMVNQTDLKYYTFRLNETQDLIALGDGELFNHSYTPNVMYEVINLNGRNMLLFKALTDISPGEQMFIDYNGDGPVKADEYIKNCI